MTNENYKGIVPYLFFDDAERAMNWYADKFGFIEIGRWHNDDGMGYLWGFIKRVET